MNKNTTQTAEIISRNVTVKTRGGKIYQATTQDFVEPKAGNQIFCRIALPRNNFLNDFATVIRITA